MTQKIIIFALILTTIIVLKTQFNLRYFSLAKVVLF